MIEFKYYSENTYCLIPTIKIFRNDFTKNKSTKFMDDNYFIGLKWFNQVVGMMIRIKPKYKLPKHIITEVNVGYYEISFYEDIDPNNNDDDLMDEINENIVRKYNLLDYRQIDWRDDRTVWIHPLKGVMKL